MHPHPHMKQTVHCCTPGRKSCLFRETIELDWLSRSSVASAIDSSVLQRHVHREVSIKIVWHFSQIFFISNLYKCSCYSFRDRVFPAALMISMLLYVPVIFWWWQISCVYGVSYAHVLCTVVFVFSASITIYLLFHDKCGFFVVKRLLKPECILATKCLYKTNFHGIFYYPRAEEIINCPFLPRFQTDNVWCGEYTIYMK